MDNLCSMCRRIFDGTSEEMSADCKRPDTPFTFLVTAKLYCHHNCIEDLISASDQGCQLCHYIWSKFSTTDREMIQARKLGGFEFEDISKRSQKGHPFPNHSGILFAGTNLGTMRTIWERNWGIQFRHGFYFVFTSLKFGNDVQVVSFSSISSQIQNLSPGTGSTEALQLAKSWVTACCTNHHFCQPRQGSQQYDVKLPTRLIYVPPSEKQPLKLCDTSILPLNTRYMTLSHSCGNNKFTTLTSHNLRAFLDEIPVVELTVTFRQADDVTRFMDVQYLRIDSLCIIQDSNEDWQNESVLMGSVYSNSYCNIAAAYASSSEEGLFSADNFRAYIPLRIEVKSNNPWYMHEGVYGSTEQQILQESVEESPLLERGWVFQERVLVPRVLYFASQQIFFECGQTFNGELPPKHLKPLSLQNIWSDRFHIPLKGAVHAMIQKIRDKRRSVGALRRDSMHLEEGGAVELWKFLVKKFTSCKLTYQSDRLIAISALAYLIQPLMEGSYVAGLWEESLIPQLLWRAGTTQPKPNSEEYIAPSWSWASKPGEYLLYRPHHRP
ncbi:HET protein [Glarea lozoyensis ATCC 20868]|uniref:HET protein n=1 Tax=Glarea lozoyensis (strain ATCC 20868 / MF5171) TaxID=1116229 RepID=S3D3D6_GLAL2|nr:HET protein [Glarea lozoyensis ATCC 20868]EPE33002.1 HET protein [Glarea lozoyensis ATCC 20868]